MVAQHGNQLEFSMGKPEESFTVILGSIISCDPAIIRRSTVVLKATSEKWPGENLAIEISWPGSG